MPPSLAYDSLVLGTLVGRHARYRPAHTALVAPCGDREVRLDWGSLDGYVNRYAHALAGLGVGRGDRVASVLPNRIELATLYWACAKLGAAARPSHSATTNGAPGRPS